MWFFNNIKIHNTKVFNHNNIYQIKTLVIRTNRGTRYSTIFKGTFFIDIQYIFTTRSEFVQSPLKKVKIKYNHIFICADNKFQYSYFLLTQAVFFAIKSGNLDNM